MAEVKFCGLVRAEDAACAAALGAAYAGAVFAGGPRRLDVPRARAMFDGLGTSAVRRVGVVGDVPVDELLRITDGARLDVLQLHDGGTVDRVLSLQERFGGAIWAVCRVSAQGAVTCDADVLRIVDAVVFDTVVGGRSGGTGVGFDWASARPAVAAVARTTPVVVAGGLTPSNVRDAVRVLAPGVVDVSSGVESAPGIKDHLLMRAFAEAARSREER